MTIRYQVVENPLREGEYFPRVVVESTATLENVIQTIVRETGVSETDVRAVLNAISSNARLILLDGRNIAIDGIGTFFISLSEKLPTANSEVSENVELRLNLRPDPKLVEEVRREAAFERVVRPERAPVITGFHDVATKQNDKYTAGNIGEIIGDNLNFDTTNADEGIFFIATADDTETHVTTYAQAGKRKVVFLTPPGLSGEQYLEVRTRYNTPRMRVTRYRNKLQPA